MTKRLLVAYASASGFTTGVAEKIGQTMQDEDVVVDVKRAKQVKDVAQYDAVVVGSGIRAGRVLAEAVNFLKRFQAPLSDKAVAYFVVCLTMIDDTEENRCTVNAYLDAVKDKVPDVKPVDVGLFAGGVDFAKLGFPFKQILRAMKSPEGDFRDWDAISSWASDVKPQLLV